MIGGRPRRAGARRWGLAGWLGIWLAAAAAGEHLPLVRLTTADGLAHDQVRCILRDARGFLWFGTLDGLSRYDGESFRNYGVQNGLASASVGALLEARDGGFWVGTAGGLCRFHPDGPLGELFECRPLGAHRQSPASVLRLYEDRAGTLWAGTTNGLFRIDRPARGAGGAGVGGDARGGWRAALVDVGVAYQTYPDEVRAFAEDRAGCLWVGMEEGLARRCGSRPFRHFQLQRRERDFNRVFGLAVDGAGRVWVALAYDGVLVFQPGGPDWQPAEHLLDAARRLGRRPPPASSPGRLPLPREAGEVLDITTADGLPHGMARGGLWVAPGGDVWIGTAAGLSRFDGQRVDRFGVAFSEAIQFVATEDRAGNLWFGTSHSGALRLNRQGLVTYNLDDGLPDLDVVSVFAARDGTVYALTQGNVLCRFDGRRFVATAVAMPPGIDLGWGHHQWSFQDREGEWWVAAGDVVLRYGATARADALAPAAPRAVYTPDNGLPGRGVFRLFEDGRGDVWIASLAGAHLARWERATATFHRYGAADGLPPEAVTAFAEDRDGGVWMGFYTGGLARYHGGRFVYYPPGLAGVPADSVNMLYTDHLGQIWVAGGTAGLSRLDEPTAPLALRHFSTADGLSSGLAMAVVEDTFGRVYVCTGRGVDRLDPATGGVAHFTAADGVANTEVVSALRDAGGDLWFATPAGLSRLHPSASRPTLPPDALLTGVRVDGEARPVSQWGAAELRGIELGPEQRQLEVAYVAIGGAREALRYEHRLVGVDRGWSPPSHDREVVFAPLAPGRYELLVRALAADGSAGRQARLAFRVLPPWWRRSWFVALAVAALAAAVYVAYRFRLAHLLSLERVRTRIATDLHDDLGASLSRISLLSEVAARDAPQSEGRSRDIMREIGALSRELYDSTADIVWAIDPRRDDLGSLVARLSEYARDMLAPSAASWALAVPHGLDAVVLAADLRRELFLLLKEAIHNAARHSHCRAVELALSLDRSRLRAEVRDDGCGFAAGNGQPPRSGNGLRNMRMRAAALGGSCTVQAAPGGGTAVRVEIPLPR